MIGRSPLEVAIIHAPGTNRDRDLAAAFELAGGSASVYLLDELIADARPLRTAKIIALPGGFSFGDALGAGRILGLTLHTRLGDALREHLAKSLLILGICNGFQALLRSGILTDDEAVAPRASLRSGILTDDQAVAPPVSLAPNAGGAFVCGWTSIAPCPRSVAPWIASLAARQEFIDCPVAHAEGRLYAPAEETLDAFEDAGQVAFRYAAPPAGSSGWLGNPNGSARAIAGLTNRAGTALGLMPHPENHVRARQHPAGPAAAQASSGLALFQAMLAQVG